jgi:hypothetical protein
MKGSIRGFIERLLGVTELPSLVGGRAPWTSL